jgi:DNA-binding NtrC family response regulator
VLTAQDGSDAMAAVHENPGIALLFSDIKMQGIDGFMLADMAKVSRPDLKVLYATGFGDEVRTKPGVRHGKILAKPYDPQQLREEVRLLLAPDTASDVAENTRSDNASEMSGTTTRR